MAHAGGTARLTVVVPWCGVSWRPRSTQPTRPPHARTTNAATPPLPPNRIHSLSPIPNLRDCLTSLYLNLDPDLSPGFSSFRPSRNNPHTLHTLISPTLSLSLPPPTTFQNISVSASYLLMVAEMQQRHLATRGLQKDRPSGPTTTPWPTSITRHTWINPKGRRIVAILGKQLNPVCCTVALDESAAFHNLNSPEQG